MLQKLMQLTRIRHPDTGEIMGKKADTKQLSRFTRLGSMFDEVAVAGGVTAPAAPEVDVETLKATIKELAKQRDAGDPVGAEALRQIQIAEYKRADGGRPAIKASLSGVAHLGRPDPTA